MKPTPFSCGPAGPDAHLLDRIRCRLEERLNQKIRACDCVRSTVRQSSSVYQVRIDLETDSLLAWIKILHGPDGVDSRKASQTLRDADLTEFLFRHERASRAFGVPEMLLTIPDAGVMVTRHAPGERVQNLLEAIPRMTWGPRNIDQLADVSHRCGKWLLEFQSLTQGFCPAQGTEAEPPYQKNLDSMVDQASGRLTEAQAAGTLVFSREELDGFKGQLARLSAQSSGEAPFCAVHADFFAGNLLASPDKITGIDFSSSTYGSPLFDPGYFIFQTETLFKNKLVPKATPNVIIQAFLDGYGFSRSPGEFWSASPGHKIVRFSLNASRIVSCSNINGMSMPRRFIRLRHARKLLEELKSI